MDIPSKRLLGLKMIPDFKWKGNVHAMLEEWSAPSIDPRNS